MLEIIILLFSVVANISLGVLVIVNGGRSSSTRMFALLASSFALWVAINYISLHPVIFDQLTWIRLVMMAAAIMSTALFLFLNAFPVDQPYFPRLQKPAVILGVFLAISSLSPWLFTSLDRTSAGASPVPGPLMALFMPFALATLVLGVVALSIRVKRLEGVLRSQAKLALTGVTITFSLLLMSNFILIIAFHINDFIIFTPLLSLIFTVSVAYGMIRRRLFDVRLAAVRSLGYLLTLCVLIVAYVVFAYGSSLLLSGNFSNTGNILLNAIIVLVLASILPSVKQFFDRLTNVIFFQDQYDAERFYSELGSLLSKITDVHDLLEETARLIENTLKSEHVFFYITYGDKPIRNGSHQAGKVGAHLRASLEAYVTNTAPGIIVTDELATDDELYRQLAEHRIALTLPLVNGGELTGYLFVKPRRSHKFSGRDAKTLETILDQLVVAIQRALFVQEVQDINQTLHERISDATQELRASNKKLQRMDATKDEFVSMASHQLRTPLTSVKGYISMVLEGDVGQITKQQRKVLEEAFTSSERMVHLISDFLNVSRLQTGKFMIERRATNLANLVQEEVDSLRGTAKAHDLRLHYRRPSTFPTLYIDENKTRQVIMNFIDNAIYYSRSGTVIDIQLTTSDGDALLEVKDTGIGVPKAEQAHLFTKFFRASNARKKRPDGTGVGIFLAKKVVTAQGGAITFNSTEGEGSTFGFRLPIKKLSSVSAEEADQLEDQPNKT